MLMKRHVYFVLVAISALLLARAGLAMAQDQTAAEFGGDHAGRFLANYVVTIYSTLFNNFPSDAANAVLQTSDGFMWFGGYDGLYRFDGARFTIWDAVTPGGFGSSNIRALHEDADRVLWIGTNDRGLVAFQNGAFTVYDRANGLPSNTIRAIASDRSGRLWGGSSEGLFYVNREREVRHIELDTDTRQFVISVCIDMNGNVFVVMNSGELYVYTADGRTIRHPYEGVVSSVGIVSGNRVIAGTRAGNALILRFEDGAFARSDIITTPLFNITHENPVFEDSSGFIWLLAQNGIGFLDHDERYQHVGNPNGVGFYTGIWQDYQNGFWITASRGGIVNLSPSVFTRVSELMGIEDTGTVNAVVFHDGLMYIGTNDGLLILDARGNLVHTEFSEIFQTRVRGIFYDSAGNIWLCTYSDLGVVRYTPATRAHRTWTPVDGMATDRTRLVQELSNGVIAVGTATGINFIKGDYVVTANEAFGTSAFIQLPDIMVLSMVYTSDSTLFIGTDGDGIYTINRHGTVRFREQDGLTGGVVLRMLYCERENGVWVGAVPGLCFIDSAGQVHVIDKVPPHTFLDILQYRDDLILLTSSAIMRANAAMLLDPYVPFAYSVVNRASGLAAGINANSWNLITDDGRLFFCTDRGVKIYSLEHEFTPFIPNPGVASIHVDGIKHGNFSERIVLPRDAYRMTIELSLLSFGFMGDAVLRYMLVGQDSEPFTLVRGDNMSISYTNLRGGDFTLRVWTEDPYGNTGSLIEISIFKELGFFEHAAVWVIIAILALSLITLVVVAIIRYRSRRFLEKQREYRTIISQALTAITNAIDAKDSYTSGHSARVAAYSVKIAQQMGMDKDFIENLYYIGLLHDVGKIGIPNEIINKPEKLTEGEYAIMKQHTSIGYEILKEITAIHNLTAGAAEHHERWDGEGYQHGIAGENITLEARIIAAADTYDAMSSDRSYRNMLPKDVIIDEFKLCAGKQFDRQIAEIVIEMIEQGRFNSIDIGEIIAIDGWNSREAR